MSGDQYTVVLECGKYRIQCGTTRVEVHAIQPNGLRDGAGACCASRLTSGWLSIDVNHYFGVG